jgi:tripartite ATP-independent transporter DctM subunit
MEIVTLFGVLFGLMAIGVPIFIAMATSSLVTLALSGLGTASVLPITMISGVGAFELLAIPFFVLMGELMTRGGLTQRIVDLLMFFLGRVKGGLAHASIGVNIFAAGVSGSAPADAAAVSSVMLPAMRREGYRPTYAAAINASAAIIGPILPPSIPMVFVALVTGLSLGQLFVGGVGPGLILAGTMTLLVVWQARRGTIPGRTDSAGSVRTSFGVLLLRALPALGAPVLIVSGIFGGFATITETSMLAAFYVLTLGLVYRTLRFRDVPKLIRDAAVFASTIMILFAAVGAFTFIIVAQRVGDLLVEVVEGLDVGPLTFLLLSMVFFLIVGMVLDAVPAILIFLPILLPVAIEVGVDPIHFGVAVVVNLMIGLLTPPVGALLYIMTKIGKVSFGGLVREVLPFIGALFVGLLVIILFPAIVTWLPSLIFGG